MIIGGGGSVGSQDWMKFALLMKEAGIDPKSISYVAFEGGGEALSAFSAGYIQVFSGDVSEIHSLRGKAKVKILAVLAPERLPGELADVPTAAEQGYPVDWRIWRGFIWARTSAMRHTTGGSIHSAGWLKPRNLSNSVKRWDCFPFHDWRQVR